METLTLELAPEVYDRLREQANRVGQPPQVVAQTLLAERLSLIALPDDDREKTRQALRAAKLLTELGPNLRGLADPTVRLEDVVASLSRVGGKPLSEIVLEQRGSNE